jgi:hypothetical protein
MIKASLKAAVCSCCAFSPNLGPATIRRRSGDRVLFDGLYKCEYRAGAVLNRSVMHVRGGRMLGGNSAFAHVGSYEEIDGVIVGRVVGQRHALNPEVRQLYGADDDELILRGRAVGDSYHFDASPVRLPDQVMHSVMTSLDQESLPPPGKVGNGGIPNGLYGLRIRALDGIDGGLTGVMLLEEGRMLGGDAFSTIWALTPLRIIAGAVKSST